MKVHVYVTAEVGRAHDYALLLEAVGEAVGGIEASTPNITNADVQGTPYDVGELARWALEAYGRGAPIVPPLDDPRVAVVAVALFAEANCVGTYPSDYEHQARCVVAALDAAAA